ncbi:suppressor of cytokine signaling 1-like [Takifugu flavidus]|uniref:Suppressor of cytokine signaling 1 n=1 Tax=Takifugu flavidus TaxID=433684 RepID=A0A5C6MVQ2_9TELE|nr:suppressor of cytokine signaling 1-like [Takifugu flavidus]XP_056893036.1 suppressor of cytokine signaling 1-like [Takifugu flavidus]XP_056893037.1 suppressor of cytokine signaling 1-like [Takifugu flavidus]XP_056893038.1 suppressor of cytokine signaling 1-like [Takifugu flavidus]XP_056893039.1 suppressor of cytokine signaling 1-like [Takifugu flavidus]XP_056893040.1 suppressor of cytokine signaling 1-like [Takifugu flavidus]TWW58859.1 hypothetical protein D4764_06G0003890 [Takifugu flavid
MGGLCRMVRDNLHKTGVKSKKPVSWADAQTQTELPEEPAGPQQTLTSERRNSAEKELEFLQWNKLSFEEEAETWEENVNGADASSLPTHLRPFSSLAQYKLVRTTYVQLLHSDYYWRSMTMEEAHRILASAQLGTFLIRDSCQPDIFFTLSYQSDEGPISIRIQLNDLLFSLCGSQRTFTSLFSLLAYYSSSSCKLTTPYRKQRPELLKQMCRRALIRTYRAEDLNSLPGLSKIKDYVLAYPYCI